MERFNIDSSILLTVISINMTIIGLTSLAEKKTIIGVDYGRYLINNYKLFHVIPLYYLLILFAIINTVALFTLYLTDFSFRQGIFIGLTVCLSFAIYYFFGYILRENKSVKAQLYENEFIGLYYKDDTPPGAECDRLTKMNNGFRTSKRLSSDVITYFNKFNNETQQAFEETFGPNSFIYNRSKRVCNQYRKMIGHDPYDYRGADGLLNISWEFFQLYRWSDLQEKWIMEILILFNDKYAKDSPEMKLNNVVRAFFHINVFGRTDNMFGYRVMDYLYKYVKDVYSCTCDKYADRKARELALFRYYCQYIYTCVSTYYCEQSYIMATTVLKELILIGGKEGHISRNEMMTIALQCSAKYKNIHVEQLTTAIYNHYTEIEATSSTYIGTATAHDIIAAEKSDSKGGAISRSELFG